LITTGSLAAFSLDLHLASLGLRVYANEKRQPEERDMDSTTGKEKEFVGRLQRYLKDAAAYSDVDVTAGWRLPYSSVRYAYSNSAPTAPKDKGYETDLLLADWIDDVHSGVVVRPEDAVEGQHWRPLVVVECKYGGVTTHDLITYSQKAAAHRALHPYIRYGLVVGGYQGSIPGRMLAHGAEFDFLAVVPATAEEEHFGKLAALLAQEVGFARTLWTATKNGTLGDGVQVIHRPLVTGWPTT